MSEAKEAMRRFLRGHRAAELRQQDLRREQGPQPAQAVAEALAGAAALAAMGEWPGPRDPASEAAVVQLRERWVRIERRAMSAQRR